MDDSLKDMRNRLDTLDRNIVDAIAERQKIVGEVAQLKLGRRNVRIRDVQREEELLTRIAALGREAGADSLLLVRLYKEILDQSVRTQQDRLVDRDNPQRQQPTLVVAYQGTVGSYSHAAAQRHFSTRDAEVVLDGHDSFESMLCAVRDGEAQYGVLPIENTTAGSINQAYDLLATMDLALVGEEIQRVEHVLIGLEPRSPDSMRKISSHPQALLQCSRFLNSIEGCESSAWTDTAGSCERVLAEGDPSHGAIASAAAAELYGLHVLARGIANQRENFTRMVVVARHAVRFDAHLLCKTSVIFATRHEHGALLKCLSVLHNSALNLTKLESRPRPNTPFEYLFYADFEGNLADPKVAAALDALPAHTAWLKVLGSYPSRTSKQVRPAEPRPPLPARPPPVRRPAEDVLALLESKPWRRTSRKARLEDTTFSLGNVTLGGERAVVFAGPAAVESAAQAELTARAVKAMGGHVLVGGCFLERPADDGFRGAGAEGIAWLSAAASAVDLVVGVPVLEPDQVALVADAGAVVVIPSTRMSDLPLLRAAGSSHAPVVLKRSPMATLDEWLSAAELILETGNQQVVLCETGVRSFGNGRRNTLDLGAIPVLRERTHLPVIVDPSEGSGTWRYVVPTARGALATGAQGLMLEVHPEPHEARIDASRALSLKRFELLMRHVGHSS
jgi:chorismate mutase / prephenate dehydratase